MRRKSITTCEFLRRKKVSTWLGSIMFMGVVVACSKGQEPAPSPAQVSPTLSAAPEPPPAIAEMELTPVLEGTNLKDAGNKIAKQKTGSTVATNATRLKQCCYALGAQAKQLGTSPEGGFLAGAAAQCNQLAQSLGGSSTAPEMGILKNLLGGRALPAVCSGF